MVPSPHLPGGLLENSDAPEKTAARLNALLGQEAAILRQESWDKLVPLQRQIARFWARLVKHPTYLQSLAGKDLLTRIRDRVEENAVRLEALRNEVRAQREGKRRLGRARRAYGGSSF